MIEPLRMFMLAAVVFFGGVALVLSQLRWFKRPSLVERLTPFVVTNTASQTTSNIGNAFLPDFEALAGKLAAALGIKTSVALRLARAKETRGVGEFRSKQLIHVLIAFASSLVLMSLLRPSAVVMVLFALGIPFLVFLISEQRLTAKAERNTRTILDELPTFSEQLAMLLDAGYSLGAAINRIATRRAGLIGADMVGVHERTQLGVSVTQAFHEWADVYDIAELNRLAAVLQVGSDAGDLGRLVSDEASQIRRELHRRHLQVIEKQSQQVWIPVTVATLIPGVILLIIPFLAALDLFTGAS